LASFVPFEGFNATCARIIAQTTGWPRIQGLASMTPDPGAKLYFSQPRAPSAKAKIAIEAKLALQCLPSA